MRPLATIVLLLTGFALPTVGCRTMGAYRVVDLPEPPEKALSGVRAELKKHGYEISEDELDKVVNTTGRTLKLAAFRRQKLPPPKAPPKVKAPTRAPPPRIKPPTKAPPKKKSAAKENPPNLTWPAKAAPVGDPLPPPKRKPTLTAILVPHKGGTRVLLHASSPGYLKPVFADHKPRDHKVGFGLNGPKLLWELHAETGYRYAPGYGHGLGMEAGARLGYRVMRLGGGQDFPAYGVELALAAGLGGGLSNTDEAGYAMPSLTLSYLIRRTLEPIPGKVIPVGPEFSIDLHAVALLGERRTALEGQLVFRYNDIAGFYVGAGYQWVPERGATFTVGLYLSTIGAVTAAIIAAYAASE